MFTGLIQSLGEFLRSEPRSGDTRVWVRMGTLVATEQALGDSIAINGACLTVVDFSSSENACAFDCSQETLSLTGIGQLNSGDKVNLEPALRLNQALGGHLVSGHIDGQATVVALKKEARSWRIQLRVSQSLAKYIAPKGSVTLEGISLTVNEVQGEVFGVNVIPHTFSHTTVADWKVGRLINLEVDVIARYVESLMAGQGVQKGQGVTEALLKDSGFS